MFVITQGGVYTLFFDNSGMGDDVLAVQQVASRIDVHLYGGMDIAPIHRGDSVFVRIGEPLVLESGGRVVLQTASVQSIDRFLPSSRPRCREIADPR